MKVRFVCRRVDANHRNLVRDLRSVGVSVLDTHTLGAGAPDLVVGYQGVNLLVEVKSRKGKQNPCQKDFGALWHGRYIVAKSAEEVLRCLISQRPLPR